MFRSHECDVGVNNSRTDGADADAKEHDEKQWLVK